MSKKDLWAKEIAHQSNLTKKQITDIIKLFFDHIAKKLIENQKVNIETFGKFLPIIKKERQFKNPQNQQIIKIPKQRAIKFKISNQLKISMNLLES